MPAMDGRRIEGETKVHKMGSARLALLAALVAGGGAGAAACGTQSATGAAGQASLAAATPARWRIEQAPDPAGTTSADLVSVACPAAAACVGVGSFGTASSDGALLEQWNGTRWGIAPAPTPAGAEVTFEAVACVSTDSCVAIGDVPVVDTTTKAFADVWNGRSWRLVATPVAAGDQGTSLAGVSCTSADACIAVGEGEYVSHHYAMTATLAESWNGRSWSILPTPNPAVSPGGGNALVSVSCASPRACMAVGRESDITADRVLTESWNGSVWKVEPAPTPSAGGGLVSVSCPTSASCTAVGGGTVTPTSRGFAEGWNGSSWAVESVAPVPSGGASLTGISCAGAAGCVAVGYRDRASGGLDTLAELWNGSSWVVLPTPNAVRGTSGPTTTTPTTGTVAPTDDNRLASVACSTPTACTAVGYVVDSNAVGAVLVEGYSS
jgi:hypothetical protein